MALSKVTVGVLNNMLSYPSQSPELARLDFWPLFQGQEILSLVKASSRLISTQPQQVSLRADALRVALLKITLLLNKTFGY